MNTSAFYSVKETCKRTNLAQESMSDRASFLCESLFLCVCQWNKFNKVTVVIGDALIRNINHNSPNFYHDVNVNVNNKIYTAQFHAAPRWAKCTGLLSKVIV